MIKMSPDQEAIKSLKFVCTKKHNFKMYNTKAEKRINL